jgi:hypothetical protein
MHRAYGLDCDSGDERLRCFLRPRTGGTRGEAGKQQDRERL